MSCKESLERGVSLIICCYNSGWIIEQTLNALKEQIVKESLHWEIILVDNCCTDNTVELALRTMKDCDISFVIAHESKAGLANARRRGISVAHYDIVIYCDDDNLLSERYVNTMHDLMRSDSSIGAAGGMGIAEFQAPPAQIVVDNIGNYAVGSQIGHDCWLYGAGVTLRTALVREVYNHQKCYLMGRKGNELLSGDDTELVMSMVVRGYKIAPTDDVTFIHVLKAERLSEEYYQRLVVGLYRPIPVFEMFRMVINNVPFKVFRDKYLLWKKAYWGSWLKFWRSKSKDVRNQNKALLAPYEFWGFFTLWKIYREWTEIKNNHKKLSDI